MFRTLGIPRGSLQAIKHIMKIEAHPNFTIPLSDISVDFFFPLQSRLLLLFFQKDFCAMFGSYFRVLHSKD
jgi:hypothetical protein